MADDTAALVLSLEARFDKFEKAMKDVANSVDKQTKVIEDRFASMTKVIEGELSKLSASLVSNLGVAGRVLGSLGTTGTAVAVGLGAVVLALNETANAAARVGERAIAIKSFSDSTGFTIGQAQGVRKAFNQLGVDADKAETVIERFTLAFDELRKKGTGPLRDGLEGVDTGLISVLLHTSAAPEAFRLVVRAMQQMATESRNTLARGLGGRGGIDVFAELSTNADKFFKAWDDGMAKAKPDDDIKKIAEQQKILNALQKEAAREWDKMFPTDDFMVAKRRALEEYIGLLRLINEPGLWEKITTQSGFARTFQAIKQGSLEPLKEATTAIDETFDTARRFGELSKLNTPLKEGLDRVAEGYRATKQAADDAARAGIAVVGTETAARKEQLATINDQIISLEQLKKVSGAAFTPQQEAQLQRLRLQQAQLGIQGGPDLTGARLAGEKEITNQLTLQQLTAKERLGLASEAEIFQAKQIENAKQLQLIGATQLDQERATALARKESFERFQALQVRLSSTPAFTKMAQDATNFAKVVDQFAVSSVNHLTDAIVDAASGTKSFEDAFRDMSRAVLQELSKLLIKMAIFQAFKAGGFDLGSLIPKAAGGPVASGGSFLVGERGPEVFVPSQSGFIVPNNALAQMGGINIGAPRTTVNVQGSADRSTIAAMESMLAARDKRFVADVASASRELRRRSVRV